MKWLFVVISIVCFGCTRFDTYYNLDDYNLNFEFETETVEVDANGTTRYVKSKPGRITLHLEEESPTYVGTYWGNDEPEPGYCGPTGLKNLMEWYGVDLSYSDAAYEMNVRDRSKLPKIYSTCTAACAGELIWCTNICYDVVKNMFEEVGTDYDDAVSGIKRFTPNGYKFNFTAEDPSQIEELIEQLLEGNPVVILEHTTAAHLSLLTGIRTNNNGEIEVIMANSQIVTLEQFMYNWSMKGIGNYTRRKAAKRFTGMKPFTAMYYTKEF